ncbi:T9SS type A sorting domain-containing protein [Pedobacter sp.]|uniref:T9SS type A sorting domain-containing protein n=1 Tax=Pedobacter sp. TaxID=1411316 RepID=UPI0031E2CC90
MKKRFSFIVILLLAQLFKVDAQGVWQGEGNPPFNYDFGSGTGNSGSTYNATGTAKSSVATSTTPGFLAYPTSGYARVYTGASSSGGFTVNSSPASVTLTASNSTSAPNKLSLYNIQGLSEVTSTFFKMSFDNTTATTGAITYAFGNSAGATEGNNIFNNGAILQGGSFPGIFNYLRWDMTATTITFSYRGTDGSAITINSSTFSKNGGDYDIEVYVNNHTNAREYVRGATTYTLPSGTFNIWVNGSRITGASSLINFPRTGELALGQELNSILMQGVRSTSGALATARFGNFDMKFIPTSTLPVNFVDFTATKKTNSAFLKWQTSSEQDNDYFEVLRKTASTNGFETIAKVAGTATSAALNDYTYTDFNPAVGDNYYQIKQVDKNGESRVFEKVALLKFDLNSDIQFSKTGDAIHISAIANVEGDGNVLITDLSGKKVLNQKIRYQKQLNNYNYNLANIPTGLYVARIVMGSQTKSFKFIK